jgi:hypothetical protein
MATTRTRTAPKIVTLPNTPPPDTNWTNPLDNPEKANAEISKLLSDVNTTPAISPPPDDLVTLPGGLIKDGKVTKTAIVRELTGADEELLSKASKSINPYRPNPFHFIDRLLRCGVVQIGDLPESKTEELLKELLVGDREQLILGIRRATYGEELDVDNWRCTNCGNTEDLSMELADIPVVEMNNPIDEISFDVNLKKGGVARVRLANGEDQIALYEKDELTQAQQETILLSRCVIKITTAQGIEQNVAGFPSLVLGMSVPDRHRILDELYKRQPGPKYDKVKYRCDACGEEVFVAVGIGNLFLDFGWV